MRVAVLGGGMQGTACAYELCLSDNVEEVAIVDLDEAKAKQSVEKAKLALRASRRESRNITDKVERLFKLSAHSVDVTRHSRLVSFLRDYDVAISAVPYFLNLGITKACIDSGTHLVDMGGNTDVVFEQRKLNDKARQAGVAIVPDCGLAPGLANILAADGIAHMDDPQDVAIRVGGLPQHPIPPLNYQLFFSVHGLINEYIGKAVILENGQRKEIDTLTGLESLHFDGFDDHDNRGEFEAVITLGGLSTLPWTYESKLQSLTYKTIRYPGHWAVIESMRQWGLFEETPLKLENNTSVSPRGVTAKLAESRLTWEAMQEQGARPDDVVLVRVAVSGKQNGRPHVRGYEIIDHYDRATGLTAMMRCTAFPVAVIARMLGNHVIEDAGVLALETIVPVERFIAELAQHNIRIRIHDGVPA